MNKNIKSLVSLLDDENQQTASLAMAELLHYENEIDSVIQKMQESDNPRLRKRIHQLQYIVSNRRRRQTVMTRLKQHKNDLINGLVELHLQWYDNDSKMNILKRWKVLVDKSKEYKPQDVKTLALFMRKCNFLTPPVNDIEADLYCFGTVLEEFVGVEVILCAIAQRIAHHWGCDLKIVRLGGHFALIDSKGEMLFAKKWRIVQSLKRSDLEEWNADMILKLVVSMLFLSALSTDSFRYVSIMGKCIANIADEDHIDFLPYPYNVPQ